MPASFSAPIPALPSLSPVGVEPDQDFADFADSAFDDELAAPADVASDVLRQREAAVLGPARPASASSLLFWLALVPLMVVSGIGTWLWKRGSAAMRLR
jgi:hypothetical protein